MRILCSLCVILLCLGRVVNAADALPARLLVELSDRAAELARDSEVLPPSLSNLGFSSTDLISVFREPNDPVQRDWWYANGLNHWFRLELRDAQAEDAQFWILKDANVLGSHIIYPHEALLLPNDYAIYDMWGLERMHCPEAWEIQSGNAEIIVTTIDTGCKITHEDLAAGIRVNPGEDLNGNGIWDESDNNLIDDDNNAYVDDLVGWDFVSHTPDTARFAVGEEYGPMDNLVFPDVHGHGSHVMGTAGGVTNNGRGVAAASWNVKAMPVRAGYAWIDGGGTLRGSGYTDDFAAAVQYAADNGARVISISFGGSSIDPAYQAALQYARDLNVVVFASAGNSNNTNLVYPAAYPQVISVAATDQSDVKASFSSFGSWVRVSAPGVAIWSLQPNNVYRPTDYVAWNGTSMASPNAAAVAALLLSYEPTLTDEQVENYIVSTADDLDVINPVYAGQLGSGRVNALAAISALCDSFALHTPQLVIQPFGSGVRLAWKKVGCAVDYQILSSPVADGIYTGYAVTADTFFVDTAGVGLNIHYRVVAR